MVLAVELEDPIPFSIVSYKQESIINLLLILLKAIPIHFDEI